MVSADAQGKAPFLQRSFHHLRQYFGCPDDFVQKFQLRAGNILRFFGWAERYSDKRSIF